MEVMKTIRVRLTIGMVVASSVSAMAATTAQAYPQGYFACYSTAVHVDGGSVDPVIANRYAAPCRPDSQSAAATGDVDGAPGNAAATGVLATTTIGYNDPPVDGDNGTGRVSADRATIVSGTTVIKADGISADAAATCSGGSFNLTSRASVDSLTINGVPILLTGGPQEVPTAAGVLHIGDAYQPVPYAVFARALWLQAPAGDIIVGESAVAGINKPCLDGPPPAPGPPPSPGFGCWANASRTGPLQPFIANQQIGPCATDHASGAEGSAVNSIASASSLYADTIAKPNPLPVYTMATPYPAGTYVNSSAGGKRIKLALDAAPISVDALSATVRSTCKSGEIVLTSSGQVNGLRINNQAVADSTAQTDIPLANGAGVVHLNWEFRNGVYVERRALWVQTFLGQEVIIGDVIAGANSNPC